MDKPPQIVERPRKREFQIPNNHNSAKAKRRRQRLDALGRMLALMDNELEAFRDGLKEARRLFEEMEGRP